MSVESSGSIRVRVNRFAKGRQSVAYTTPDDTNCIFEVTVREDNAKLRLLDFTFDSDSEGAMVDVMVFTERTESGLRRMGAHKTNNRGSALEVVEDKETGQFVIAYGVPSVRMGTMFVSAVKELDMLVVAHIYSTREESFSVVAQILCDSTKGLTYYVDEPTQHSSPREALQAVRKMLERREDITFEDPATPIGESHYCPGSINSRFSNKSNSGFGLVLSNAIKIGQWKWSPKLWFGKRTTPSPQHFCPREALDPLNLKGYQHSGGHLSMNLPTSQAKISNNYGDFAFAQGRKTKDGNSAVIRRDEPTNGSSTRTQTKSTRSINNGGGSTRGDFNGSIVNINIFIGVVQKHFW